MTDSPATPIEHRSLRPDPAALAGAAAVLLWTVFCVRWFDVAAPWRPAFLAPVEPLALLAATALASGWSWTTTVPLPEARPSAFTTKG